MTNEYPVIYSTHLHGFTSTVIQEPHPFKQGDFGWLYEVRTHVHRESGEMSHILKVIKAAYGPDGVDDDFEREIAALSHLGGRPGIPRITWSGKVRIGEHMHPAFAYVKIAPAVTLSSIQSRYFGSDEVRFGVSCQTLFDVGLRLLETLEIVHAAGIRHLDIHPGNILISREESVRKGEAPFDLDAWLIDFGKSSVPLKSNIGSNLSAVGSVSFKPRSQVDYIATNKGRYLPSVLTSDVSAGWDLYALGVCCQILADEFAFQPEEASHRKALLEFGDTLRDEKLAYKERIANARNHASLWKCAKPRINNIKVRTFVAAHASLEPLLVPILDSQPVQRLRRVQQLALTQLIYPGATHTRFAHTLGVVDLADRYIGKINSAHPLPDVTPEERLVCLAYALLHDIGHYPFAHYFEEIDESSMPNARPLLHHERLGQAMYVRDPELTEQFNPLLRRALENTITSFDDSTFPSRLGTEKQRTPLGQIIDGPIDVDKLDYLVRDGNACGISYANGIDVDRLLDSICIVQSGQARHLGLSIKGVASASELYYTRFHMYSEVYHHKVSRFVAAAVKRAFFRVSDSKGTDRHTIVKVLLQSSELQVVDYLRDKLVGIDDGRYLDMLEEPFGAQGRRLFKRLRTYSDIWLSDDANRAHELELLTSLRSIGKSFRVLGEVESRICDVLDKLLKLKRGQRACLLIDVPPSKDVTKFPLVLDARGLSYLNKVNPIVQSAATAQSKCQRVRVFASRATYEALTARWPSHQDFDKELDDLIRAAIHEIKPT